MSLDDAPAVDAAPHAPSPTPIRTRLVLALLLVSTFAVVINETAMGVAIPPVMADLEVSAIAAQWLTTSVMLTLAVVIPVTGVLLQRYTLRRNYFTAMGLFAAGTLLAVLAPTFEVLLAARVVQAVGTAIMLPLLFTTVMTLVEPERRGRAMGLVGLVTAVAPALGPTISGVLLTALGWRGVFAVVLPVALLAIVAALAWLRNVTPTTPARFDALSVVLSALGFSGLIYGLVGLGDTEASGIPAAIPLAVGLVALGAFVARQRALRGTDRVLLELAVFRTARFTLATIAIVISAMALFGSLILLPLYLQQVLGEPAHVAGLALLPGGILSAVLAPLVGLAYDRVGPRVLIVPGAVVVTAAMLALSMLDSATPVPVVIAMHVGLSLGTSLMLTPLMTTALGAVAPELYSHASALVNTLQQVAGAAGIAVFVALYSLGAAGSAGAAGGVQAAFVVGSVICAAAIPLGLFLRRARN